MLTAYGGRKDIPKGINTRRKPCSSIYLVLMSELKVFWIFC